VTTLWFLIVAAMLAAYTVLDGFDLGAGAVHLIAARNAEERGVILRAIGPVWDGNEVWLIAAGGTLYFAFPRLYAASFSGFYLPLMIVLWLLMMRGISIEFRNHLADGRIWRPFWDAIFSVASALLAVFFGAALGNVVRGVPLDAGGWFFEPLWADGSTGGATGILDAYTILTGATALFVLALHGALYIVLRTEGALRARARLTALRCWWVASFLTIAVSVATFRVQPAVAESFASRPWLWILPALGASGLAGARLFTVRGAEMGAFLASSLYVACLLASAAAGIYPNVLPSHLDPAYSLTIHNAATSAYGLRVGLMWFAPGMVLVIGYFVFAYRRAGGKVATREEAP